MAISNRSGRWQGSRTSILRRNIIFRKQIAAAGDDSEVRDQHIQAYKEKFMNPYIAAARGFVDEVIRPEETREKLAAALEMLKGKRRAACTHGNIPL